MPLKKLKNKRNASNHVFPKTLSQHCPLLNKEDVSDCTFKNVNFCPGWIVVGETELPEDEEEMLLLGNNARKKNNIYEWVDRSPRIA